MKKLAATKVRTGSRVTAALLVLAAGSVARADIIEWLNPTSNNWSNPLAWSDGNVPNNLLDVAYIGKTGANYTITVDFDVPMEALTLDSPNATINLNGSRWMYVAAVHPDSFCHIRQGNFYVQGGATLKSDRKISVSEPNARIYLNNGALEGAELEVNDGGLVQLNGTGYIRTLDTYLGTPGQTSILVPDSLTIVFDVDGQTISGGGELQLASSYYGSTFQLRGDVTNNAVIRTSNHAGNYIYGQDTAGDDWTLTNGGDIIGSGYLGNNTTTLVNTQSGNIIANQPTQLIVDPGAGGMDNQGELIATSGGTLNLTNGGFYSSHPTTAIIRAENASAVLVNSSTVYNHTFETTGTGYIDLRSATLLDTAEQDTEINGLVRITDSYAASLAGNVELTGNLQMLGSYYGTTLSLIGDASLYGGGLLSMSNFGGNTIHSTPANAYTLYNADCTIRGAGQLGNNNLGIGNFADGQIQAAGSAGLVVNPSDALGMRNEGLMAALAGGRLYLDGPGFDNSGGTIHAAHDGIVYLRTAGITGGQFTSDGNGYFYNSVSNSVLTDVTSHAPLYIPDSILTRFQSTLVNTATLHMTSSYYGSTFLVQGGNLAISGGGTISLSNHTGNNIYGLTGDLALINQDNLITGSGNFGNNQLTIINNSTIEAAGSTGLVMNPSDGGGLDNNALMRAAPGGRLYLDGPGFNNSDGTIHAADTGIVYLRSAQLTGGQLTAAGSGYFTNSVNNSVLTDVTSHAPLYIPDSIITRFQSTLVNTATLHMTASYYGTTFLVQGGDLLISGGGTISLSNYGANYIYGLTGDLKLINQDNLITGSGNFGNNQLTIINNSTIEAVGSTGLVMNPSDGGGLDNNVLMRASPGGRLYLDGPGFNNTDGTIHAADTGIVYLRSAHLTGGHLTAAGSGYFTNTVNNSILTDVTNNAPLRIQDSIVTQFQGTLVNNATVHMDSSYYGSTFFLPANLTISGGGTIALSNHASNFIYGTSAATTLTNSGNTIRGCGQFGNNQLVIVNGPAGKIISDVSGGMNINPSNTGGFTNQGLLHVSGAGVLSINDGPFTTSGQVLVDAGRKLDRTAGDFIQTGGATFANGELEVDSNNYLLQGGSLGGAGLVDSNVINSGGSLAPGNSPGTLTIEGNYTQQAAAELAIEIGGLSAGQFDKLAITGAGQLAGALRLFNINFIAEPGDQVTILTTTGTLSGTFDQLIQPLSGPRWGVTYLTKSIVLTAFCGADFDSSGFVDLDDYIAFVAAFDLGGEDADFDNSGFVDLDDFIAFVTAFESGC